MSRLLNRVFRTNTCRLQSTFFRSTSYMLYSTSLQLKPFDDIRVSEFDGKDLFFGLDKVFWPKEWENEWENNKKSDSPLMSFDFADQKFVAVFDPDLVRDFYKKVALDVIRNDFIPTWHELLGQKSIILLHGKDHAKMRQKLQKFFTFESMRYRFDVIQSQCYKLLQSFYDLTQQQNGEYIDGIILHETIKNVVFQIGLSAIFGINTQIIDENESKVVFDQFQIWFAGISDVDIDNLDKPDTDLGKAMIARKQIVAFANIWFDRAEEEYVKCNGQNLDESLIFKMIESGLQDPNERIGSDEIGDILLLLIVASYETTAASLCNVISNMYQFKEETCKLKIELDKLPFPYAFDDIMNNACLDSFVKESMRVRPTLRLLTKKTIQDTELDGYQIPAQTNIVVPYAALARNENVFPNPDCFSASRWIENAPSKYAYSPFSIGKKKCLGEHLAMMELKLLVTMLLRESTFEIDENYMNTWLDGKFFSVSHVRGKFYPN